MNPQLALLLASLILPLSALAATGTVYKNPQCGCCTAWAEHLAKNGVSLKVEPRDDLAAVRAKLGVPADLGGCHTAKIDGYVFEGHVPADLVKKVLKGKPAIAGLAVPGMPAGSPGMEGPTKVSYPVIAFDRQGKRRVYATR
ncbi:DUF411 domain-containing protein [Crenobacter cavernae]|uniref:DUF411 domain-containing protein n=1 Tax=Crenobacter cavernae TaxID=2290923 RepID=A0A345Y5V6_9NEIS|nr:DUF411 domain-containing protein [Crenobacter cavernae]AXK39308.1 DUF411 domain-containing protein [Crenobacter cavernae]